MVTIQLHLGTSKDDEHGQPPSALWWLHEGFKLEEDSGNWSVLFHPNCAEAYYCLSPLVSTLHKKFDKATIGLKDTADAFLELSAALDGNLVETWKKEEQKAQVERGEALRIYDIQLEQGMEFLPICSESLIEAFTFIAPSQADIRLCLTSSERKKVLKSGTITWLVMGISLEDEQ